MKIRNKKVYKRQRRHRRVRGKVFGSSERLRLCVFRSSKHIYAQIIDDSLGRTLASASSRKVTVSGDVKAHRKIALATEVGRVLAESAKEKGIQKVAFDRGGYRFHGRVAALAESARKNGLEF